MKAKESPGRKMIEALNQVVIPVLRELGFKGHFPNLYRLGTECSDLLTFHFDKRGGGLVVEIATAPVDGYTQYGRWIPISQLKAIDIPPGTLRTRLKPKNRNWFRYDQWFYVGDVYLAQAKHVLKVIKSEGIPWWAEACQRSIETDLARPSRPS